MTTPHSTATTLLRACIVFGAVVALWFSLGAMTAHGASVSLSINGAGSANVPAGSSVTLRWDAVGVSSCTINNGVGSVPATGTRTVTAPNAGSVTYTIACAGGLTSTASVSVKPYVDLFTTPAAGSPNVAGGQADITVNWNAVNATKCTLLTAKNNATGATRTIFSNANQPTKGKYADKINANTTYTLTCVNAQNGQSDTESQAVTFVPFGPPQITSFTTNRGTSKPWDPAWNGVSLQVRFQSTNTEKCLRTAKDKNGNVFTLAGWTATNLNSNSTDWTSIGAQTAISDTTTFEIRCGRPSTNEWVTSSLLFTVTGVPAGGGTGGGTGGGSTSPTAEIFTPASVSVARAADLPVRVEVETKSSLTNRCTYQAFTSTGTPINVPGWTDRNSVNGINSTFSIRLSQTTKLRFTCTRTTDNVSVYDEEIVNVQVSGGTASNLDLTATAIGEHNNVQQVRLEWTGENVSTCSADDVIIGGNRVDSWYKNGTIPLSGVKTVGVFSNTTYSLTCTNAATGARVTDTVLVLLNASGEAEVVEASANLNTGGGGTNPAVTLNGNPNPSPVAGTPVTLTWTGSNVTNCTLTGGGLNAAGGATGSRVSSPAVDTTYSVACTGPNGPANDTELVTIGGSSGGSTVDLTITDPSTGPGDPVTLAWDGTNVTNCVLRNSVTNAVVGSSAGPDGTATINPGPMANTNYQVTCDSPSGPVRDDEDVTVSTLEDLGDSMDIEADPIVVRKGSTTELTWFADPSLTSQTSCVIEANGSPITGTLSGAGGTVNSPVLEAETIFALVCAGVTTPPAEASVRVRVLPVIQES